MIMGCRDSNKARRAARELMEEKPTGKIVMKYLDCCDLSSVRAFAMDISREMDKVDVLINNAGVCGDHTHFTVDGFESIFQTNFLAPFLLIELLLPMLKKSAPSRIINVGSSSYLIAECDLNTLADDFKSCPSLCVVRYGESKLLLMMYSRALHKELEGSGEFEKYSRIESSSRNYLRKI